MESRAKLFGHAVHPFLIVFSLGLDFRCDLLGDHSTSDQSRQTERNLRVRYDERPEINLCLDANHWGTD